MQKEITRTHREQLQVSFPIALGLIPLRWSLTELEFDIFIYFVSSCTLGLQVHSVMLDFIWMLGFTLMLA